MTGSKIDLGKYDSPLIIAHRGYRTKYPENTLVAFEAALDAGAHMLELDVRLAKDRKMVVIHDENLERTTGKSGPVSSYTLAELKALNVGGWFQPCFGAQRIPTLEEILELFGGRVLINIEIKGGEYEESRPSDAVERQVVELVLKKNLRDSVLISSFEWKILRNIADMRCDLATALISRDPGDDAAPSLCRDLQTFSWNPNCFGLNKNHVIRMRDAANVYVFPYNVDSRKDCQRMLDLQVDGVIVSDPLMVRDCRAGKPGS
jgi:glycerophosphoryl diester phosphodiesterase